MVKVNSKDVERFLSKICIQNGHWLFVGDGNKRYAQFKIKGKMVGVHRFAYQLWNGKIPQGLHIDHECQITRCCNPEHLKARTSTDNNRLKHGWYQINDTWFCKRGHSQLGYNVYNKGDGFSKCRECMNDYFRARNRTRMG